MISSKTNTGVYTTVAHAGVWKVLIIMHNNAKKSLELSVTFPSDKEARKFMESNEPFITFASNKAFSIVKDLGQLE